MRSHTKVVTAKTISFCYFICLYFTLLQNSSLICMALHETCTIMKYQQHVGLKCPCECCRSGKMLHQTLYFTDSSSSEQNVMKLLSESVYEKRRQDEQDTLKTTEKWKWGKKTALIPVETDVVHRCRRPGPSNSLSRANGSVDNLLLHRRWDRFTLAAYWNCNLAVSMTTGTERLHGNSQSHRTMWRIGINSHNTLPVWEFEIRAEKEITSYFWEDSLEFQLQDSHTVKMGLQSSIPKDQLSLLTRLECECDITA